MSLSKLTIGVTMAYGIQQIVSNFQIVKGYINVTTIK